MRLIYCLSLALSLPCTVYAQDRPTASLEELRVGNAMLLADRLLPADARADVVSGTVRREHHLPGQAFDAIYTGSIRPGEGQTCLQSEYRVELHNKAVDPNAERADPGARLPVTKTSRNERVALAGVDSATDCAPASGFVHVSSQYPDRQLYAMRTLAEMIGIAGAGGIAPEQVDCTAEGEPCDGVAKLAALNIGELSTVRVTSGRKRCDPAEERVQRCYSEPVAERDPFDIEATLSVGSGQIWRASWTAEDGKPLALRLRKSRIAPF